MTTMKHRITWFVVVDGVPHRHKTTMRGSWGYDVTCSCGWQTRTGGAVRRYIREEIDIHKREVIES